MIDSMVENIKTMFQYDRFDGREHQNDVPI